MRRVHISFRFVSQFTYSVSFRFSVYVFRFVSFLSLHIMFRFVSQFTYFVSFRFVVFRFVSVSFLTLQGPRIYTVFV